MLPLLLNVDGLPIFSSSGACVWPVLCGLLLEPLTVFPVALTFGETKPNNLDFLQDTINELNDLLKNDLNFDEKLFQIELKGIVCDAPAKAMIKNIKQYSGYYGCDQCNQKGVWLHKLTYQQIKKLDLRTDFFFREQMQKKHFKGLSPFCSYLSIWLMHFQ